MNRRRAGLLIAAAAILLGVALALLLRSPRRTDAGPEATSSSWPGASSESPGAPAVERFAARLYFPTAGDRLMAEEREIAGGEGAAARATAILASFLSTPPAAPRVPAFSDPVEVGTVLLLGDGTLVADLRAADAAEPPASGSTVETLRIYAVVHTLLRNVQDATQVVLLWNGRQRPSFAGHVDTARPLRLRADLEVAPPVEPAAEPETP